MSALEFDIRPVVGDDIPFIYSTWVKSYFHGSDFGREHKTQSYNFYGDYNKLLDYLLPESKVLVATVKDNPNTVLGYIVYQGLTFHYLYIKSLFRNFGLAKALFKEATKDNPQQGYVFPGDDIPYSYPEFYYTHKTRWLAQLINQTDSFMYRATALLKTPTQGESHAQSPS